jgi:hypothetical protein
VSGHHECSARPNDGQQRFDDSHCAAANPTESAERRVHKENVIATHAEMAEILDERIDGDRLLDFCNGLSFGHGLLL